MTPKPKRSNNKKKEGRNWNILKSRETGIFLVLLIICVVLALVAPRFLKLTNITNVVRQISVIAIISVGMTLVIVTGGIDLSVGSTVAFAGCISALCLVNDYPIWLCVIVGILLGTIVGLVNGILIVYVKLAPFIATLGTMGIARGLVLAFTRGYPIQPFPKEFELIGRGYIGPLPIPVLIMFVIVIIGHIFLSRTKSGRYIYYIGSNKTAARLSGLNVDGTVLAVYTITGLLAGLASVVLISRLTSAQSNMGSGAELDAIAAVVIGGTSLSGGEGSILGSLIGATLMGVIKNALILLGVNVYWQSVVIGVVIVLAVAVDAFRQGKTNLSWRKTRLRIKSFYKKWIENKRFRYVSLILFLGLIAIVFIAIRSGLFRRKEIEFEEIGVIAPTTMPVQINPEKVFGKQESVSVCDTVLTLLGIEIFSDEKKESDLLVIDIHIVNESGDQIPLNSFDFTIVDGSGKTHTDVAFSETDNPIASHRLNPGDEASGKIAYFVPTGDDEINLIWQPGWCTGVAYIELK
ncbi:MAG TPA: DUF4352 domain-containing protein [Anaerolineae bacterium]|nr:DUF4352 domain-containing protein [Anaerolineae bacterium]